MYEYRNASLLSLAILISGGTRLAYAEDALNGAETYTFEVNIVSYSNKCAIVKSNAYESCTVTGIGGFPTKECKTIGTNPDYTELSEKAEFVEPHFNTRFTLNSVVKLAPDRLKECEQISDKLAKKIEVDERFRAQQKTTPAHNETRTVTGRLCSGGHGERICMPHTKSVTVLVPATTSYFVYLFDSEYSLSKDK